MWDTKLELIDTDNSMLVVREKEVGGRKSERGQIYGDGRLFEFGWWFKNNKNSVI